jgi:hypothetical protein
LIEKKTKKEKRSLYTTSLLGQVLWNNMLNLSMLSF